MLLAAWFTPLPQLAASGFTSDTLVRVAVLALAAPLVAAPLAASPRLMARLPRSRVSPMPVAMIALGVVWLWHLPILHGLARLSPWVWAAEQVSLLVVALLLWITALRPPVSPEAGMSAGILALLLTAMHMVLLGLLLMLAPLPLYDNGYAIQSLSDVYAALAGQRVGGLLMLLVGGLAHLAGGLYLGVRRLRPRRGNSATAALMRSADGR